MNIVKEDNSKQEKMLKIFYISIISICVLLFIVAIVAETIDNNTLPNAEKHADSQLTNDKTSLNKEQFSEIFENKVNYLENNAYKIKKLYEKEEIVYLGYENHENQTNDYELDVNIPYINIKNEIIQEYNKQIKEIFEQKAKDVLNTQNNNIIYTVDYSAYVSNNILSVVVRSTLKEGGNAQRDIVQTYNYDLSNQKKCTIDDILELKGITKDVAEQKIKNEIKKVQKSVDDLAKLGYTVYSRDYKSDIYDINNVTDYFLGKDNSLYIIYAYGNLNHTSEMDIVVM